ncbi:hypothetical protein PVAND_006218 [Polypedilum vanderplanki]|uniref:Protein disulfide isomerase n=1 Tax=Polypedilum vanderplanki TaxID=319348 RepID=A0A9J6C2H5_POLVA|nr:hypothetical protein PVAND_006218 [Polypedilum vanderplanki]
MQLFTIILSFSLINLSLACSGCIDLDELTFEKILSKFKTALVKFDQSFPYGENHEAFAAFSQQINNLTYTETTNHPDVLIATVGVKDYGDMENKKLADKYGVSVEAFPAIKLFNDGNLEQPISFDLGKEKLTVSKLFLFLKEHASAYVKAPGCNEELDELSKQFMAKKSDKNSILKKAKAIVEKKKSIAKFYVTLMKNSIEKGKEFIALQQERMTKLLGDKISEKKSEEINKKLNILMSFKKYDQENKKEEL